VAQQKIKRAITWIRRALEITERNEIPDSIAGEIVPSLDAFGWDRLNETVFQNTAGTNVSTVSGPAVPQDVLRVVLEASVETSNALLAFTMWIDHFDSRAGTSIGVMRPIISPISAIVIRNGMQRPLVIMRPGDQLRGRCTPATGAAETLTLRQKFVDLPVGEYIPL